MRLALPERPIRRADAVVGALYMAKELWVIGATIVRVIGSDRLRPEAGPIAFLAPFSAFDLLFAIPGIGVAQGRRWGFILVAILSFLAGLGEALRWLLMVKNPSIWFPAFIALDVALGLYCTVRLRYSRRLKADERSS